MKGLDRYLTQTPEEFHGNEINEYIALICEALPASVWACNEYFLTSDKSTAIFERLAENHNHEGNIIVEIAKDAAKLARWIRMYKK